MNYSNLAKKRITKKPQSTLKLSTKPMKKSFSCTKLQQSDIFVKSTLVKPDTTKHPINMDYVNFNATTTRSMKQTLDVQALQEQHLKLRDELLQSFKQMTQLFEDKNNKENKPLNS